MTVKMTQEEQMRLKEGLLEFVHSTIADDSETHSELHRDKLLALPRVLETLLREF